MRSPILAALAVLILLPAALHTSDPEGQHHDASQGGLLQEVSPVPLATAFNSSLSASPKARPSSGEVWGYGMLMVTLISLTSIVGVAVLPLMSRSFYSRLLTALIGLAVGSLVGSAVFHLIPSAFRLSQMEMYPHHSYLYISMSVWLGMYLFFVIERFLKMFMDAKARRRGEEIGRHGHSHATSPVVDGELEKTLMNGVESVSSLATVVREEEGGEGEVEELQVQGEPHTFADSVLPLLASLSSYLGLQDQLPGARVEVGLKMADLLKLFNSRTCQLVLGAGAVSLAGLKTITIRNLAVTLRTLSLVSGLIPSLRARLLDSPGLSDKQEVTLARNLDSAAKDYSDHLGEVERKIVQIVDAALSQQLGSWERRPPVPSASFKAIGKQLTKLLEAVQDVLPSSRVAVLFSSIHSQFLNRVGDRLKAARLAPDNSPTHGLVLSELIFYRENLRYLNVLGQDELSDGALQVVWRR